MKLAACFLILVCSFCWGRSSLNILVLGDGYCQSVGLSRSWPQLLKTQLDEKYSEPCAIQTIANEAWGVKDLRTALLGRNDLFHYDAILIMIGELDARQDSPSAYYRKPLKNFYQELSDLMPDQASRIFIFSIPDWSYSLEAKNTIKDETLSGLSQSVDRFNLVLASEAQAFHFKYFDITELTRDVDETAFTSNGKNYCEKFLNQWVELCLPAFDKIYLEKKR